MTILVEGESLFNDASAIVVSRILLGIVMGGAVTWETVGAGMSEFLIVFSGGLMVGLLLALATGYFLSHFDSEPHVEITMVAVLANTLVFLLVGLQVDLAGIIGVSHILMWVIAAMMISRAVNIYGMLSVTEKLSHFERVSLPFKGVMFWGGLRGAIALALVMSLPEFSHRETFINVTIGAVLFTLFPQGLSIEWLVHKLKLDIPPGRRSRRAADRPGTAPRATGWRSLLRRHRGSTAKPVRVRVAPPEGCHRRAETKRT